MITPRTGHQAIMNRTGLLSGQQEHERRFHAAQASHDLHAERTAIALSFSRIKRASDDHAPAARNSIFSQAKTKPSVRFNIDRTARAVAATGAAICVSLLLQSVANAIIL